MLSGKINQAYRAKNGERATCVSAKTPHTSTKHQTDSVNSRSTRKQEDQAIISGVRRDQNRVKKIVISICKASWMPELILMLMFMLTHPGLQPQNVNTGIVPHLYLLSCECLMLLANVSVLTLRALIAYYMQFQLMQCCTGCLQPPNYHINQSTNTTF